MAVFTFSTKGTKPSDTEVVEELKNICSVRRLNFSAVLVDLIRAHVKELANEKPQ